MFNGTQMLRKALFAFAAHLYIYSWLGLSDARSAVPIEVAIGIAGGGNDFRADGYGVLVRYGKNCLVVTLAHVINPNGGDFDLSEATARVDNRFGPISFVDADEDRDLYIGEVGEKNPLYRLCRRTDDISALNERYKVWLGNALEEDFREFTLHATPTSIDVAASQPGALRDARRRKHLSYILGGCVEADTKECLSPMKGFSGSIVSKEIGGGDRLWLGLHQGCVAGCDGSSTTIWQAVTVMQIYEFVASPNSPLNSKDYIPLQVDEPGAVPDGGGPSVSTPFPEVGQYGVSYKAAMFEWDVAFSKFLDELHVMEFPAEGEYYCAEICTQWNLNAFYNDKKIPTGLRGFRSNYESLGEAGSELIGTTMRFPIPFNQAAFREVISRGKRLNTLIDQILAEPEGLSMGERLGFAVHGSADVYKNFFQKVPAEYLQYVEAVKVMYDRYCLNFRPAASAETEGVGEVFFGNIAAYDDPCMKPRPWNEMVVGDPSFVLKQLQKGLGQ